MECMRVLIWRGPVVANVAKKATNFKRFLSVEDRKRIYENLIVVLIA